MHPVCLAAVICLAVAAGLFLLWIFLLHPGRKRAQSAAFTNCNYAHRGLWGDGIAENSLSAFARAVEAGEGVELDVQLSRDGVAMVFHDDLLERVCGVPGRVRDYTAEELGKLSLSGTQDGVPTFAQVLHTINGQVPVLMEIKAEHDCDATCREALAVLQSYTGPLCMESFNPLAVRSFARHRKDMVRGLLVGRFFADKAYRKPLYYLLWGMVMNAFCHPDFLALDLRYAHDLPFVLCRRIYRVPCLYWTVRTDEVARDAEALGGRSIYEHCRPETERRKDQ